MYLLAIYLSFSHDNTINGDINKKENSCYIDKIEMRKTAKSHLVGKMVA